MATVSGSTTSPAKWPPTVPESGTRTAAKPFCWKRSESSWRRPNNALKLGLENTVIHNQILADFVDSLSMNGRTSLLKLLEAAGFDPKHPTPYAEYQER
jgi:hypothetical protein